MKCEICKCELTEDKRDIFVEGTRYCICKKEKCYKKFGEIQRKKYIKI